MKSDPTEIATSPRHRLKRVRAFLTAAAVGGVVGLLALTWLVRSRQPAALPPLKPEDLAAARQRWAEHGPEDYRVTVEVSGRQAARYEVEVRNGRVESATRNGHPLRQSRTRGTWSVPGMFNTIQSDVTHWQQHHDGSATASTPRVFPRGVFDPHYGYPVRYLRSELQRYGSNQEVSWVASFQPL